MLNFNKLKIFYEAAKTKNFTKAADNLFITQPAISSQIKSLEEEIGFKLFVKIGKKCELTPAGLMLFEAVKKIFEYEKEILYMIDDIKKSKKGVLRIGAVQTYVKHILPLLILKYYSRYPNIKIIVEENSSLEIYNGLLEQKYDIVFIGNIDISTNNDVVLIPFTKHKLFLITSPEHKLSKRQKIKFEDLKNESLVLREKSSAIYQTLINTFHKYDLNPNILMETNNTDLIKDMVKKGKALSFLVYSNIKKELEEGFLKTISIDGEKIFLKVFIAIKNDYISPPTKAFLKLLKKDKFIAELK